MKFEINHIDTCLPDYFGGHHLPYVQIIPWAVMTLDDIKGQLLSEVNQDVIGGSWDWEIVQSEEFYYAVKLAIEELMSNNPDQVTFFNDLEQLNDDDGDDSVYAYFVFVPIEE